MSVYFFLLFITAMAGICAVLFRGRFEQALPCCVCGVILVIYISGLVSSFVPGFLIVLFSVPVAGIFCIIKERKRLFRDVRIYVLTPGFLFFSVTMCIMLPWTMQMKINSWDEFSHWGTVIKNFWFLNDFANLENSTTSFKGYPPAASIFAWFAQRFGREYVECKSYLAYHTFYVALMAPYFCVIREKKDWWKAVLLGICAVLLPTIGWYRVYDVTYVDGLLGMQAALVLVSYLLYEDGRWKNATILLMTAVLCLTKASGAGLCGMILVIFLIAEFGAVRSENKPFHAALFLPCLMGMAMIAGKYSWEVYLKASGTAEAWDTSNLTLHGVGELLKGQAPLYRYEVIRSFLRNFAIAPVSEGSIFSMSCLGWLVVFTIAAILLHILYIRRRTVREKTVICAWGVNAALIVYALTLLLLYLFTYSEGEALACASFGRYMGTWLICCIAVYMTVFFEMRGRWQWSAVPIVLLIGVCGYLPEYKAIFTAEPVEMDAYREYPVDYRFQSVTETLDAYGRDDIKVFFVHQQDSGFWYQVCKYGLTPYQIQPTGSFSFGEGYPAEDWMETLKKGGYTHVFLNHVDDVFGDNFEILFESKGDIEEPVLYEVTEDKGKMKFKKVEKFW